MEFLDFTGPLQTAYRHLFGFQSARDYWFPEIRSLTGAIIMLSLVLYPYVYMLARTAFLAQRPPDTFCTAAHHTVEHRYRVVRLVCTGPDRPIA